MGGLEVNMLPKLKVRLGWRDIAADVLASASCMLAAWSYRVNRKSMLDGCETVEDIVGNMHAVPSRDAIVYCHDTMTVVEGLARGVRDWRD